MTKVNPKLALIYVRVSTEKQDSQRQIEELKGYAKYKGYKVVSIINETVSGMVKAKDRKGFSALLEHIEKENIKYVLVYEISRLGRSLFDVNDTVKYLTEKNISIYSHSENLLTIDENGKQNTFTQMLILILAGLASMEREQFKTRSISGIRHKVSLGFIGTGGVKAYGYTKDSNNKLVIDQEEKKVVESIFKLYLSGLGTQQIAQYLNKEGIPTKYNKEYKGKTIQTSSGREKKASDYIWKDGTIYAILKNTTYIGERPHKGEIFKIEAIIEKSDFNQVQEMLKKKANKSDSKVKYNNPLKDLLSCGYCGKSYFLHKRADGKDNAYKCLSKREVNKKYGDQYCGNTAINYDRLNSAVHKALAVFTTPEHYQSKTEITSAIEVNVRNKNIEKSNTENEITTLERQSSSLIKLNLSGQLSIKEFTKEKTELNKKLEALNNKLNVINTAISKLKKLKAPDTSRIAYMPFDQLGEYLKEMVSEVKIFGVQRPEKFKNEFPIGKSDTLVVVSMKRIIELPNHYNDLNFIMSRRTNKIGVVDGIITAEKAKQGRFKIKGVGITREELLFYNSKM